MLSGKKIRVVGALCCLLLLLVSTASATHEIPIKINVYQGVTCSDATIEDWFSEGTWRLCYDLDDGGGPEDVPVDAALKQSGTIEHIWTCTNGTKDVTDSNVGAMMLGMGDVNACVVQSISWLGSPCAGISSNVKRKILIRYNAVDEALVHEVGHLASDSGQYLKDLPTSSADDRIMYYLDSGLHETVITDCPTNHDERDAFESMTF